MHIIEADVQSKVAELVLKDLTRSFNDKVVFGPVKVVPKVDHYGDEYLHIYIVFNGDLSLLPRGWRMGLLRNIDPQLEELGVVSVPDSTIIEKADWEETYKYRYHELS